MHSSHLDEILSEARVGKIEEKKSIKEQQGVFTCCKKESELVTRQSLKLCESMAEKGKPFGDNIYRICMSREETFGGAN